MVYMVLATAAVLLLAVKLLAAGKYQYLVENVDPGDFPLCSWYGIGFSWSAGKLLALKGKTKDTLISQAKLLYDARYAEYYASLVWAQTITFTQLGLTVGFLLAGLLNSGLMVIIGFVIAGVFGWFAINQMKEKLDTREMECTSELPEIVSSMALLTSAGMPLRNAWRTIADSQDGTIYMLMRQACADMDNGMSEAGAIHRFGSLSNSLETRKFASTLAQSLERGGSELVDFLGRQSTEMWSLKKQTMLQKGEQAASKLLAPTALLFVAIIIAVLTGAIGMLI